MGWLIPGFVTWLYIFNLFQPISTFSVSGNLITISNMWPRLAQSWMSWLSDSEEFWLMNAHGCLMMLTWDIMGPSWHCAIMKDLSVNGVPRPKRSVFSRKKCNFGNVESIIGCIWTRRILGIPSTYVDRTLPREHMSDVIRYQLVWCIYKKVFVKLGGTWV